MEHKGFTLVEIVIATLIIVILAASVFGAFLTGRYIINLSRHRYQAVQFAKEAVDRLRSGYNYTDSAMNSTMNGTYTLHNSTGIGLTVTGDMNGLVNNFTYNVTEPVPDGYKRISVYVNWTERR